MTPCCLVCIDVTVVPPVFVSNMLYIRCYCEKSEYTYTILHGVTLLNTAFFIKSMVKTPENITCLNYSKLYRNFIY